MVCQMGTVMVKNVILMKVSWL